jgi:single-strand DNA-binding protein
MAEGLNRVMLLGNLGADPELRMTPGGQAVLKLRLATSETYLDKNKVRQEKTEWHSVVLWGKRAESLSKILSKGDRLFVEGSLNTSSYDDKDGNKRYKTEVKALNVLLNGKGSGRSEGGSRDAGSSKPSGAAGGYDDADYGGGGDDDDIPFAHVTYSASEPWWRF